MTLDSTDFLTGGVEPIDFDVLGALHPEQGSNTEGITSCTNFIRIVLLDMTFNDLTCFLSGSSNSNRTKVKSVVKKRNVGNEKKIRQFKKGLTVKEALKAYDQKPNMSRRNPTNVLVAFPVFDKCDSLLYFPTSLIRHFNSADFRSASILMHKYVDKTCIFTFNCTGFPVINHTNYLHMMDIGGDLEPDRIMCVHSTKVVENQINATIYMKVTDLQPLYNTLPQTSSALKDVNVAKMGLYRERAKRFQAYADDAAAHSEQLKQQLLSYSYAEEDVLLYLRLDFALTIDNRKGKIVKVDHVFQLTSVHEAV